MPGKDRKLDPSTGDYVETTDGTGFQTTTTAATAMYHQMKGRLNSWPGDNRAGSTVSEISLGHASDEELIEHRQKIRSALGVLEDERYIANPRVEMQNERDRVGVETFSDDINNSEIDIAAFTTFED